MNNIKTFFLEENDDTYLFSNLEFTAECDGDILLEPYTHKETDTKTIKYYPSKNLFVAYDNNIIVQMVFTSTCWSDDYEAYNIENNIGVSYTECYHGKPNFTAKECNKDFSNFIRENNL